MRLAAIASLLFASILAAPGYAEARIDYLLHCGGCHLPDGRGAPPEVPTLRDELGRIAGSDEGRAYLVRVPGSSQAPLSDADLTRVVNWVLQEFNQDTLPERFKPLSEREVARARANVLADPIGYREEIWGAAEEY